MCAPLSYLFGMQIYVLVLFFIFQSIPLRLICIKIFHIPCGCNTVFSPQDAAVSQVSLSLPNPFFSLEFTLPSPAH